MSTQMPTNPMRAIEKNLLDAPLQAPGPRDTWHNPGVEPCRSPFGGPQDRRLTDTVAPDVQVPWWVISWTDLAQRPPQVEDRAWAQNRVARAQGLQEEADQECLQMGEVVWKALDQSLQDLEAAGRKLAFHEGYISPHCHVMANEKRLSQMLRLLFTQALETLEGEGWLTIDVMTIPQEGRARLGLYAEPYAPERHRLTFSMDLPLAPPRIP